MKMKMIEFIKTFCFSQKYYWLFGIGIILVELLLNSLIVWKVPYTEIDWIAYMQEVGGVFKDGQWDYQHLRGDTGPLVYPAGFVYLYYALYLLSGGGVDILTVQWVFVLLHTALIAVLVLVLRQTGQFPPLMLAAFACSKRVHSIFVLRLFNDCWAMFLCYLAILFFVRHRWYLGCVLYSLAVSVKMNILLFAPGLLLLLVQSLGALAAIGPLLVCAAIQLLLAAPFLLENPWSYLAGSFDLGRKFFFIWTVNWKFLPEEFFVSNHWSLLSLCCHLLTLLCFAQFRWCAKGIMPTLWANFFPHQTPIRLSPSYIVEVLFTCNFIGIVFARSLHYQFYSWYFHTLPFLFFFARSTLPFLLQCILFVMIEYAWNVFPSTPFPSFILFSSHIILLVSLWQTRNSLTNQQNIHIKNE